ncbi:MAG: SAM-dependent methyltransferase, partial [Cyanobacteria bacterium P01_A01_bin.70]
EPMQVELQKIHAELHKAQIELQQTQAQLMQAQTQADHWQATTQAMEANRLWQLRNAWVGLKGALGLRKK